MSNPSHKYHCPCLVCERKRIEMVHDRVRLDALENHVAQYGPLVLHGGCDSILPFSGLSFGPDFGRTLRQALDHLRGAKP